uniref:Tick transposon n=1 Tax=Rhipicephalus appendiculatus TaxID=34631 RepID=A0A131YMF4_RHIAP
MFSIDVEDLYYNLPHEALMHSVKLCITEDNDEMAFASGCGVSVGTFLEILSFYLTSTNVEWKGNTFIQRSGVCIGSKVAPVLSNIFLGMVDTNVKSRLGDSVMKVLRYVDDFFIFVKDLDFSDTVKNVLGLFHECGRGLKFTYEVPQNSQLQFLDVNLKLCEKHVCWQYYPRSNKPILNFNSAHSKVVKNGIDFSCLFAALFKTCTHLISDSFLRQIERLRCSGFSDDVLRMSVQKLIKRMKSTRTIETNPMLTNKDKCAVIPYAHKLSHGLKNVASRFNVKVLLSAPNKMKNICGIIDRKLLGKRTGSDKNCCKVKHTSPVVPCRVGVVYQVPFSCGHVYIGQTGRCLNIRLMEHKRSLDGNPYSHLARHRTEHGCTVMFEKTVCIFTHSDAGKLWRLFISTKRALVV